MPRYARCGKCKKFFTLGDVSRVGCPACEFRTARCEDCGGQSGAVRSVLCHVAYWRTRGKADGGHVDRMRQVIDVITRNARRRVEQALGLVRAGEAKELH